MFDSYRSRIRSFFFKMRTHNMGKKIQVLGKYTIRGTPKINIGENCVIYPDVIFWGDGELTIGDNCKIGDHVILCCNKAGGINIGRRTIIAANCYLIDSDHNMSIDKYIALQGSSVSPIHIGDDCWLGTGVVILKGTHLNNGCVCGAMSLIKGKYPENAIIVGVPGKIIKYRK